MTSLDRRWGVWGLAGLGVLLGVALVYGLLGRYGGFGSRHVESDMRRISSSSNLRLWYLGSSYGDEDLSDAVVTSDAVLTQGGWEVAGDTTVDPGQIVLISYGRSCSEGTVCGDGLDIYEHRAGLESAEAAVCLDGATGDQELRDAAQALRPFELSGGSLPPAPAKVRVSFRECSIVHGG